MNNRPDGSELLAVARRVLLDDLLPLLPAEKTYDALMVANAMAIAAREFGRPDQDRCPPDDRISQFYRQAGLDDALDPTETCLAAQIRKKAIPPSHGGLLYQLLVSLTRAKLAISNPKHLGK